MGGGEGYVKGGSWGCDEGRRGCSVKLKSMQYDDMAEGLQTDRLTKVNQSSYVPKIDVVVVASLMTTRLLYCRFDPDLAKRARKRSIIPSKPYRR